MNEDQVKNLVKDFKEGTKVKDLVVKYNVKAYYIGNIISKLRKAGANIPKKNTSSVSFDYAKLASEINSELK